MIKNHTQKKSTDLVYIYLMYSILKSVIFTIMYIKCAKLHK